MLNEPPEQQRRVHPLERKPSEQPAEERQQVMLHIPFVKPNITLILIAINVVIFGLGLLSPEVGEMFLREGANNQIYVVNQGEYLRLFYAMFLHASVVHIFFNMYALYVIGRSIEGLFGHLRFALIYFLGGLTGSLLSVLLNPPFTRSVGASGAVFAIIGAEIIYLYQHRKLLGENGRQQLRSVIVIAVMNLALGFASSMSPGSQVRIDNWGHIGGLIGGLVLTWYIGPIFLLRRHPHREGAFIAEDSNPIKFRYQVISLYTAVLLLVLIAATFVLR